MSEKELIDLKALLLHIRGSIEDGIERKNVESLKIALCDIDFVIEMHLDKKIEALQELTNASK